METENGKIVLGIDISTKCIGSTIAMIEGDGNIKVLEVSHLKLRAHGKHGHDEELFVKSELFREKLRTKYSKYYISEVIIEEPLIMSNNSVTVATLMRFNGMISQLVKDVLGVIPKYISSYDARKYAFPSLMSVRKYNKHGENYSYDKILKSISKNELVLFGSYPFDCAKKYILWNMVSDIFPDIKWEYDDKNELKDENFDASDSLICIMGYVNKCKYGNTEPEIICCNSTDSEYIEYTVKFCGDTFTKRISFEE